MDRDLKRCLGQMMKAVQIVATTHDGVTRGFCSHWVMQVSFDEPVLIASISPKHDTHTLIERTGWFTVSNLAGDQVDVGQYFSYPGRKYQHIVDEYWDDQLDAAGQPIPVIKDCISWLKCEVRGKLDAGLDHDLYLVDVTDFGEGRLGEPPLLYSSRMGWRISGDKAREPGRSIRDELNARLAEHEAQL